MTVTFLRPSGSDGGAFRRMALAAASLTVVSLLAAKAALAARGRPCRRAWSRISRTRACRTSLAMTGQRS